MTNMPHRFYFMSWHLNHSVPLELKGKAWQTRIYRFWGKRMYEIICKVNNLFIKNNSYIFTKYLITPTLKSEIIHRIGLNVESRQEMTFPHAGWFLAASA